MEAVVFEGVGQVATKQLPLPEIERPTDAIIRIALGGLCGSDLHPCVHPSPRAKYPVHSHLILLQHMRAALYPALHYFLLFFFFFFRIDCMVD